MPISIFFSFYQLFGDVINATVEPVLNLKFTN